jgi:hypothetical protein
VGPDQGNMWQERAIRLTPSRLVAVAGLGRAPASARTRRPAGTPAAAAVPARPAAVQVNARLRRLKWCLREAQACLDGGERERGMDFTDGGGNGGMGRAAARGKGERAGFYRRARTW